jgi:hypothetical protein
MTELGTLGLATLEVEAYYVIKPTLLDPREWVAVRELPGFSLIDVAAWCIGEEDHEASEYKVLAVFAIKPFAAGAQSITSWEAIATALLPDDITPVDVTPEFRHAAESTLDAAAVILARATARARVLQDHADDAEAVQAQYFEQYKSDYFHPAKLLIVVRGEEGLAATVEECVQLLLNATDDE